MNNDEKIAQILLRLESLEKSVELFAKHIEILEERATKFSDKFKFGKFKFGKFKFVKLSDEKQNFKAPQNIKFSLNDD